jgi:hypothetical protein
MKAFNPYVSHLEELLIASVCLPVSPTRQKQVKTALDGQPSVELRKRVSLGRLRAAGAFFTGSRMAQRAVVFAGLPRLKVSARVFDPACGVGDLLVAFVNHLSCSFDLESTLSHWGTRVVALDVQPEFVRATKLRLALAGALRHPLVKPFQLPDFDLLFPNVAVGSSLVEQSGYNEASHILVNPPFTSVDAPEECIWGEGKVNSAALFMDACATNAEPGTQLIAILPDVLRSGSRYEKWRKLFERRVAIKKIEIMGRFDRHTDVDVFVALGQVRKRQYSRQGTRWTPDKKTDGKRISDKFKVSVGAVVSYRDPHSGPWYPFVQARDLPTWQAVTQIAHHRRFEGKTVSPPFVVVRRTSRPEDRNRAVATLVRGKRRIAVENHLLVLRPKDKTIWTCEQLLKLLQEERTNYLLNRRIRCRHLTVSALGDLPWRDE